MMTFVALLLAILVQDAKPQGGYKLPYEYGKSFLCNSDNDGSTHTGQGDFAFDFALPVGTPVCAARDGVVLDRSSPNESVSVLVQHDDGTVAMYTHLKPGGILVEPGEKVFQGDIIALSGSSGTEFPHLHFHVTTSALVPVRIRFDDVKEQDGMPFEGLSYTSGNKPVIEHSQRSHIRKLEKISEILWGFEAWGLAYGPLKDLADIKVPVELKSVKKAKERVERIEKIGDGLLKIAEKLPAEGDATREMTALLLARQAFRGSPWERKINKALRKHRKHKSLATATESLEEVLKVRGRLYQAVEHDVRGATSAAINGYRQVIKAALGGALEQAAKKRLALLEERQKNRSGR